MCLAKYIIEHSRILTSGLFLADGSFTIKDSIVFYCAEVKTPPFTKGKEQLKSL